MNHFICPFSLVVAGISNSGKTFFVQQLIKYRKALFDCQPRRVIYVYQVWQQAYDQLRKEGVEFIQGLPKNIRSLGDGKEHSLLILDDVAFSAYSDKEVENLYTTYVHHLLISTVFISQNIFYQSKRSKTISVNTHYICLFKNPRGADQIEVLGRQIFGRDGHLLTESYQDAMMQQKFPYLLVCLSPQDDFPAYSLRTKIFPLENTIIYKLVQDKK